MLFSDAEVCGREMGNNESSWNGLMNINNITRVYAKIKGGGGGIPPLAAHAYAVDTRRLFFPAAPPS